MTAGALDSITTQEVGKLRLRVWHAGQGPGLLYLHGTERHPGDAPFLHRLAKSRTVIAPELPGYGESTGIEHVHDLTDLLLMLRRLVDESGLERVDVVGHGLGGMLAAEFAILAPNRTRTLVLVDSYGLWLDDLPMPDPFTMNPQELASAKWHEVANARLETHLRTGDEPLDLMIERTTNSGTATRFLWPIPDRGLRRRIDYLTAPTLVLHGASDGLVPLRYAEEFTRLVPDSELHVFQQSGHLPMFEAEDEFVRAVESHLEKES